MPDSSTIATTGAILICLGYMTGIGYLGINAWHNEENNLPAPASRWRDGLFIASHACKYFGKQFEKAGERQIEKEQDVYNARKQQALNTANQQLIQSNQ